MIRQAPRLLFRSSLPIRTPRTRRLLSTVPPAQKSRSWKSSAARWGLAIGAIYYYNTSDLFAEEPPFSIPAPEGPTDETSLHTLESMSPRRDTPGPPPSENPNTTGSLPPANPGLEATEEEASQEGAFNEETGEINWDCPCLGGMAHGPCGEQFRAAFSCFVFSKNEPKGMDCIPNFKTMQDCFRQHPDIYGAELEDDEEPEGAPAATESGEIAVEATAATPSLDSPPSDSTTSPSLASSDGADDTTRAKAAKEHMENTHSAEAASESDELVPKAAHDATSANTRK